MSPYHIMQHFYSKKQSIKVGKQLMMLNTPKVMGILNITPDSFFDGGSYTEKEQIKNRVLQLKNEGTDIIDIGAYSSRPNAEDITAQEEINRLDIALQIIKELDINIPISIDTFRSEVAAFALEKYQVEMINDISAGDLDPKMIDVIAQYKPVYIIMHMRGTPQSMTSLTEYKNMCSEIIKYFSEKLAILNEKGINDVIIDPGFGFAKTLDQNYELLKKLDLFNMLETPILAGISRKSMLYKLLDCEAKDALNATSISNTIALAKGADILRVHDVKAAKECVAIYSKTENS